MVSVSHGSCPASEERKFAGGEGCVASPNGDWWLGTARFYNDHRRPTTYANQTARPVTILPEKRLTGSHRCFRTFRFTRDI